MQLNQKKKQILEKINFIIDTDVKEDKCDQYTEYAIYLQDEIERLNYSEVVNKLYDKLVGVSSSIDLYKEYESIK